MNTETFGSWLQNNFFSRALGDSGFAYSCETSRSPEGICVPKNAGEGEFFLQGSAGPNRHLIFNLILTKDPWEYVKRHRALGKLKVHRCSTRVARHVKYAGVPLTGMSC
jgi:hypothetical protein